jgi:hypothetical protein
MDIPVECPETSIVTPASPLRVNDLSIERDSA